MIAVDGLRKVYGEFVAVHGSTLPVEPGEIFGVVSPNGVATAPDAPAATSRFRTRAAPRGRCSAVFATATPIALISPLTLVVCDLQGEAVALGEYLFSTGPFYLTAGTLFAMGADVYREEDVFTRRPVPLEFPDASAAPGRRAARTVYSPGVLGLLGAAALSPVNPTNVAARLAIGNADAGVSLAVGAVVAPGAVAVTAARTGVARHGPA